MYVQLKLYICRTEIKLLIMGKEQAFNVTGIEHGSWVYARCKREAVKIFRKRYKSEKVLYCNILGRLTSKMIM